MISQRKVMGFFVFSFIFLILLSVGVAAVAFEDQVDIFHGADINVNLEESYNSGDVIDMVISIDNWESFPIVDAYLIVEVLKGCEEPVYPSQYSDCDNIFEEIVIDGINVPQESSMDVPFSYVLPSDLKSGTYRMDYSFRTKRTPIVGLPHIFLSTKYQFFEVVGEGTFPYAKILRTKTNINNETGPIGVGVAPNEDFTLDVYVDSETAGAATLEVSICDWQDSICDLISTQTQSLSLVVGEQMIPVSLKTPESPDAYAIRIELKDANGLVSLYRSRVVVLGSMAKIRKLYTDNYFYNNENMKVDVLIAGSPDHYTRPVVENIFLKVTVTDLMGDEVLGEKTQVIGDLDADNLFADAQLSINVPGRLIEFETCAELTNSETNQVYERYCYITDANKFPSLKNQVKLKKLIVDGVFLGEVCVYDAITGNPTDSELFVTVKYGGDTISQERGVVDNCLGLNFEMDDEKTYSVFVQDIRTGQDFVLSIWQDPMILGVSRDLWLYSVFGGAVIIIVAILLIVLFALKRRSMGK